MLNVTLSQLIQDVQLRADVLGSTTAFPTSEITDYINRAIARVHGLLALSGEPYYRSQAQFTTTSGQQQYYTTSATGVPSGTAVLPTDIFRIEAIDAQTQTNFWQACSRMNWEQRNDYQQGDFYTPMTTFLYSFAGSGATSSIWLQPLPAGATPIRVWYFPVAPQLANPGDTWDSANRWDEYVIAYAARLVAERDENYELAGRLDMLILQTEQTIKAESESRVSGQAPKIRRARYRRRGWPYGGLPGGIP